MVDFSAALLTLARCPATDPAAAGDESCRVADVFARKTGAGEGIRTLDSNRNRLARHPCAARALGTRGTGKTEFSIGSADLHLLKIKNPFQDIGPSSGYSNAIFFAGKMSINVVSIKSISCRWYVGTDVDRDGRIRSQS